jgi:hypothetical protein
MARYRDVRRSIKSCGNALAVPETIIVTETDIKEQETILKEVVHSISIVEELEATIETNFKYAEHQYHNIEKEISGCI